MNNLQNWVFKYNTYTKRWMATTDDCYFDLSNNIQSENIVMSKSIDTLEELIIKYDSVEEIKKNIK